MKTQKELKALKKEILLVELPEQHTANTYADKISICNEINNPIHFIEGSYTLLGTPDEIKETDLVDLVENKGNYYKNYSPIHGSVQGNITFTALESFNSALESEIYWDVNPLGEEEPEIIEGLGSGTLDLAYENKQWKEAQEKTFDRNQTLIFVKN